MGSVWGVLFALGQVPEVATKPIELGFLLTAEFLTAGAAVVSGIALLLHKPWAYRAYLLATGFLAYSITNYVGGLIQSGDVEMAAFIAVMGILTAVFFALTRSRRSSQPRGAQTA